MNMVLSEKQKRLWEIIKSYMEEKGVSPTYETLRIEYGVKSLASIASLIKKLVRKGFVQVIPGVHHGIRILKTSENQDLIKKPLIGMSAAGRPVLAEQNIEDQIEFSVNAVNAITDYFLKVKGDSMIGAGINDGDFAAGKENTQPNNGDIVVFMIDNESTIKRFYKEKDFIVLKAANENYPNIIINNTDYAAVVGKVVGVLKK